METFLNRYRNLTVLLVVVLAQLLFLAYQVKANKDDRLIRVWAVSAVTPMAGGVEALRHNTIGFLQDYFILLDVRDQNRKLQAENDKLRMDNIYYRNQLATAEHAKALTVFQTQTPSKTVAARVIGNSTVASAKAVFIDRGSTSGIERGMAVVTPDGIVGKVIAVYPMVSQVLLVTDATFKVGIESQKNHVHGILNCGSGHCIVEQVQEEDKLEIGEWFFTSGEDRVFPRGFPVGTVISSQPGQPGQGMRDVKLELSGAPGGVEAVLVVLEGVHEEIPTGPVIAEGSVKMLPPPPSEKDDKDKEENSTEQVTTEADKVVSKYQVLGKEENHVYGAIGSNIPNFNAKPGSAAPTPPVAAVPVPASSPASAQSDDDEDSTPIVVPVPTGRPEASANATPKPEAAPKPVAPKPAAPKAAIPVKPQPELPLGSPRRKPATTTDTAKPPQ
jgi:rod shape-determining protein MreC